MVSKIIIKQSVPSQYLFAGGYASFSSDTLDEYHYYIQARQYDAIGVPGWNKPDQLAEKYYGISPYAMCAGNPVNFGDYEEKNTITDEETKAAKRHGEIPKDSMVSREDHKAMGYDKKAGLTPEQWEERCKKQNIYE